MSDPVAPVALLLCLCCCLLAVVAVVVAVLRRPNVTQNDNFFSSDKELNADDADAPEAIPMEEWDGTDGRWRESLKEDEEEGE